MTWALAYQLALRGVRESGERYRVRGARVRGGWAYWTYSTGRPVRPGSMPERHTFADACPSCGSGRARQLNGAEMPCIDRWHADRLTP